MKVRSQTVVRTRQNAVQESANHFSARNTLLCCQPVECLRLLLVEVDVGAFHTPQLAVPWREESLGSGQNASPGGRLLATTIRRPAIHSTTVASSAATLI